MSMILKALGACTVHSPLYMEGFAESGGIMLDGHEQFLWQRVTECTDKASFLTVDECFTAVSVG